MKLETQSSAKLTQLAELIKDISVAMLTTEHDSGLMTSRPMSPLLMDTDGAIWFFTDRTSAKTQHLDAMNLSFVDPSDATYVSISGTGRVVDDRGKIESLWSAFARPVPEIDT
jgi:general stress protein 26